MSLTNSHRWQMVGFSYAGTSHLRVGKVCEDAFCLRQSINRRLTVAAVCDGAGSAKHGRIGARLVSRAACAWLIQNGKELSLDTQNYNMRQSLCEYLLRRIKRVAIHDQQKIADYACTLVATVVQDDGQWVVLHIGDGGVVGLSDGLIRALSIPTKGEYINETCFVTTSDAMKQLVIHQSGHDGMPRTIDAVALFTDGLERSFFNARTTEIAPALGKMFSWIREMDCKNVEQLLLKHEALFKSQSTDDGTIVLLGTTCQEVQNKSSQSSIKESISNVHSDVPLQPSEKEVIKTNTKTVDSCLNDTMSIPEHPPIQRRYQWWWIMTTHIVFFLLGLVIGVLLIIHIMKPSTASNAHPCSSNIGHVSGNTMTGLHTGDAVKKQPSSPNAPVPFPNKEETPLAQDTSISAR